LAEDLNITVNQIRNMLYRLHKHNLVSFIRKKDKKKGWYIYYWTLDLKNTKGALQNFKRDQLEDFKGRLEKEEAGVFYVCPNKCRRYHMEQAMEVDFRCQECGELVREQDNARTIVNLKDRINELEVEVANTEAFEEKRFATGVSAVTEGKAPKLSAKNAATKAVVKKAAPRMAVRKTAMKKAVPKMAVKKAVPKKALKKAAPKMVAVKKAVLKKAVSKKVMARPAPKPAKKSFVKSVFKKLVKRK
ncbi:MAG: hypothetical protein V1906_02595, partial [Candidatus Woesearchaeota archaeon]